MPSGWQPLLSGPAAAEARRVAAEVAEAIETDSGACDGPSVNTGAACFALLNAYLARVTGSPEARGRALAWLQRALAGLAGPDPTLLVGAAGVAWTAEHVTRMLAIHDADPEEHMEDALLAVIDASPDPVPTELLLGLTGYGVYALERLPRPGARTCLERVVVELDRLSERTDEGIAWFTPPELLPPWQVAERAPDGYYNLGAAHGAPAIAAFLAAAGREGAEPARALAEGAVSWMLAHRLPSNAGSAYPAWIVPGQEPVATRAAWCYGDPGVAGALHAAGRALEMPAWQDEAVAIARGAAAREPADCGVVDAWLCHGAAGLGHIFNRLYQASGDALLADAARFWLERALQLRSTPDDGFAGFDAATLEEGVGFLMGAAGVALALLAAASDVEPGWDRLLCTSTRADVT